MEVLGTSIKEVNNKITPGDGAKVSTDGKADSFTFKVDKVDLATKTPNYTTNASKLFSQQVGEELKLENFSHEANTEEVYTNNFHNGFMSALFAAYQYHYRLTLSVSDFILVIAQSLSEHINANAEKLRSHFVDFEGKQTIEISRDNFVKGGKNDWSTVFGEFATEIKKRVKADVYGVVIDDTSVATKTTRIVSEITLMGAMKKYFDYQMNTLCGIPEITLKGTPEDWKMLKEKVHKLNEMNKDDCLGLKKWLDDLTPTIDQVCEAGIERKVDVGFWSGIFKYDNPGSGSAYVSGWCKSLFLNEDYKIECYSKVPFIWNYHGEKIDMDFFGGFLGAKFNKEDTSVQPEHFWAVAFKPEEKAEK